MIDEMPAAAPCLSASSRLSRLAGAFEGCSLEEILSALLSSLKSRPPEFVAAVGYGVYVGLDGTSNNGDAVPYWEGFDPEERGSLEPFPPLCECEYDGAINASVSVARAYADVSERAWLLALIECLKTEVKEGTTCVA